ncbi:Hypothetical protein D9617_1g080120 [Elsinoe fawcettii]|nr:Hypothetical protein D9617_1g080120 [Elsinoe fawcettii]
MSPLADVEARLSPLLNDMQRNAALKIHQYILSQPIIGGKRSIERAKIRDAAGLHVDRKSKTGQEIINSRMGVVAPKTQLVNKLHQNADAEAKVLQPDSKVRASDVAFTEQEWIWLCIPGTYNPWLDTVGKASHKKRKTPFGDDDNADARTGLPTPPSTVKRAKRPRYRYVESEDSDEDDDHFDVQTIGDQETQLDEDDEPDLSFESEGSVSDEHNTSTAVKQSIEIDANPDAQYEYHAAAFADREAYHNAEIHSNTSSSNYGRPFHPTIDDEHRQYPPHIYQYEPPYHPANRYHTNIANPFDTNIANPFDTNIANDNYSQDPAKPSLFPPLPERSSFHAENSDYWTTGIIEQALTSSADSFLCITWSMPKSNSHDPGFWPCDIIAVPQMEGTATVNPAHLTSEGYLHDEDEEERAEHLAQKGLSPAPIVAWNASAPETPPPLNPFAMFGHTTPPPSTHPRNTLPSDGAFHAATAAVQAGSQIDPTLRPTILRTEPEAGTLTASATGEDVFNAIPIEPSMQGDFDDWDILIGELTHEAGVEAIEALYGENTAGMLLEDWDASFNLGAAGEEQ